MSALATIEVPELGPAASLREWVEQGERLSRADRAIPWLIGDWWNAGEPYGERVAQAARIFPQLSIDTIRNYGTISKRFDVSRRRDTLSWRAHADVASLQPSQADSLLDRAAHDRWSMQELQSAAAALRPEPRVPRWMQPRQEPAYDRAEAKEAIFTRLNEAAAQGAICPTADELVEVSGVGSVSTTVALVHALEDEGRIAVDRYQRGRTVTILATGARTAEPADKTPHWRDQPRDLPTPAAEAVSRDRPSEAQLVFAAARRKGMSVQDYLLYLVWLGWEVEREIDSAREARGIDAAA